MQDEEGCLGSHRDVAVLQHLPISQPREVAGAGRPPRICTAILLLRIISYTHEVREASRPRQLARREETHAPFITSQSIPRDVGRGLKLLGTISDQRMIWHATDALTLIRTAVLV